MQYIEQHVKNRVQRVPFADGGDGPGYRSVLEEHQLKFGIKNLQMHVFTKCSADMSMHFSQLKSMKNLVASNVDKGR